MGTAKITKIAKLLLILMLASSTSIIFGQSDSSWQSINPDTVFTNKHVEIDNTLEVYGKITADSLRVRGPLHVGDSSLTFINDYNVSGVLSDHIRSTQGRIAFMGGNANNYNTNINIGIGVHNPTAKIELNYNTTGTLKIGSGNRAMTGGNSAGNLHIDATNTLALSLWKW
jgi:hypothetical protein